MNIEQSDIRSGRHVLNGINAIFDYPTYLLRIYVSLGLPELAFASSFNPSELPLTRIKD
jgi:hypothetical protein